MKYTFTKPSTGDSVPTKKKSAVTGPRPTRLRADHSVTTSASADSGYSHCPQSAGSGCQRG